MKLQQYISIMMQLSRRKAGDAVKAGHVMVNGHKVHEPFVKVDPFNDRVQFDGRLLTYSPAIEAEVLLLLHKPPGYLTSDSDGQNRPLVKELFTKSIKRRLFPVGRLDFNSEGLMLYTNNGELAQRLAHPKYHISRTYRIKVHGVVTDSHLKRLRRGFTVRGLGRFDGASAKIEHITGKNTWLRITLARGRNRELRKIFAHLGLPVVRLIRIRFGPFSLKGIEKGSYRKLTESEIAQLHRWLEKRSSKSKI